MRLAVYLFLLFPIGLTSTVLGFQIPGIAWIQEQLELLQLQQNCSAEKTPNGVPIFTEPATVLGLYQTMKDVHDVLTYYGIPYRVDCGTLLGAIRHQGIIPWDDDLDVCIDIKDVDKILALAPIFNELGYEVSKFYFSVLRVKRKNQESSCVDFLLTEQRGDKIYFARTLASYVYRVFKGDYGLFGYRNGEEIFITEDELYPLQPYKFGDFIVMGPKSPMNYLNGMYGNDCLTTAYQWHAHRDGVLQGIKKVKMTLSDKDKVPALPTGPILEKIAALAN